MANDKLTNPITKRKIQASIKNAKKIASSMHKRDIPLSWRRYIEQYKMQGVKIEYIYAEDEIPDRFKLDLYASTDNIDVWWEADKWSIQYLVRGSRDVVKKWIKDLKEEYAPCCYGTHFTEIKIPDDLKEREDTVMYKGSRSFSGD